ncbi:MAG TPA: PDZ domain-containing protein, partial [Thermoleophilaceae bacterium]|nr:PDZ domain-containing protein [Thermoleophilaceae bacterium]
MGSIRNVLLALCCLTLALVAGIWLGGHPGSLPSSVRDAFVEEDRALRAEVIDSIKDNFYKPVKDGQLEDASLKGIVQSLDDPYSHYLSPNEAKQFQESVQGEFSGVGMSVEKDRRGLRVLNIFDGSPAKQQGVRKGDLIIAVNGRSIAGLNSQLATARIKGKAGTRVRLEVLTPGQPRSRTLTVERKTIKVPVAEGRVVDRGGRKWAVVELQGFSSGAHGLLQRQLEQQVRRGAE